jgi:hypothetical protein
MPMDAWISFDWFPVLLTRVLRVQGFSSEALAQCQSAADVEHKLEELEDLHHVSWSCSAWLGRLRRLSELLAQDLADDIGMDLEDLYSRGGGDDSDSDYDSDMINAESNFGICDPDGGQRECLDLIALKRCLPGCTRSLMI